MPYTDKQGLIVLDVRPGKDTATAQAAPLLHFVVDTGAGATVLEESSTKAHRLDLGTPVKLDGPIRVTGSGDAPDMFASKVYAATLKLESANVSINFQSNVTVIPTGVDMTRFGIDGALGLDLFQYGVIEIDYAAHRLRFYDEAKFQPPPAWDFARIPLHFMADGIPFITVDLTPFGYSASSANLEIDTGADSSVTLYSPFISRVKWDKVLPRVLPMQSAGVNGLSNSYVARLRQVQLGPTALQRAPVTFSTATQGAESKDAIDGSIGAYIWSRFDIILDFQKKVLYLKPHPDASESYPMRYMYGFELEETAAPSGGYPIHEASNDFPMAKAGIKAGEILFAIDGHQIMAGNDDPYITKIGNDGGEHSFEIVSADGKTRRTVKVKAVEF